MKFYKNQNNQVFAFEEDGSQDDLIVDGLIQIEELEASEITKRNSEQLFDSQDYYRKRLYSYPPIGEFIDAFIKGDADAMEEYKKECFAVKAKYPKDI